MEETTNNIIRSDNHVLNISLPLFIGLYLCALASGIVPQTILSLVVIFIIALLFFSDKLYYVLPVMIFYYYVFGTVMGISVFRIFTILVLAKYIIADHKIKVKASIIPAIIFILYCVFILSTYNLRRAIFTVISILAVIVIINDISDDEDKTRIFFSHYTLAALCSFVTGLVEGNRLEYSEMMIGGYTEMSRFMATFEDPNYMGFFFTIAIFAVVTLELFPKVIRAITVITLTIMVLTSLSMTAIVGNLLIWVLYLLFGRKVNLKTGLVLLACIVTVMVLINTGALNSISFLNSLAGRIQYKILAWEGGNINTVVSGRAYRVDEHLNYFNNQSVVRQLFGGNLSTPLGVDRNIANAVAHNEYVDELLDVGVIGEAFIIGQLVWNTTNCIRDYYRYYEKLDFMKFILKFVWFYYAMTLTVFLDYRFIIAYFI